MEERWPAVSELSAKAMEECRRRWDAIAKPLHGLGKFEDALVRIAGMTGSSDLCLDKKALVVFCADNGVVEEGVTQAGQEVTARMAENLRTGRATSSIMCRAAGADLFPIDLGVAADTSLAGEKIAYGTNNIIKGPAMSREQAMRAVQAGIRTAEELKRMGYRILAAGEMGIGNTTTGSALASVFLGLPPEQVTGRGAGLSSDGLRRKVDVIRRAIAVNEPDPADGLDVLAKVGGLDLAGMTGLFLGGAKEGIPVVVDGMASCAAAMAARAVCPQCVSYLIASHRSSEPASALLLQALGLDAVLDAGMHLGEGTGALALFPLLDLACAVYNGMATFDEARIEPYRPLC